MKTGLLKQKMITGLAGVLTIAMMMHGGPTIADINIPDNQKAALSIAGTGVAANVPISLSTGPKQTITTQSDSSGNFLFSNLNYASFSDLEFTLDIPPNAGALASGLSGNHLELSYDPRGATARVRGTIGKSGMIAFNLKGEDQSNMQIAGQQGFVNLQTRTNLGLASGSSELIASIINVGEVCCPRMIVPAPPVTLMISSVPLPQMPIAQPSVTQPAVAPSPVIPYIRKDNNTSERPIPNIVTPPSSEQPDTTPKGKPAKRKIPYIVQGSVEFDTIISLDNDFAAAVSFPAADYDKTYVGGIKKIADEARNAIANHVAALGAMMDGRNLMNALRTLQVSTVETMNNYAPSDTICRFGTLSRSLAGSEAVGDKNRLAFSKAMTDRNNQQQNGVYGEPLAGVNDMLQDFKGKYCEPVDNNGFLKSYCAAAAATSDLIYNRDVDFTRQFDVPLTLDADFTGTAPTNDQQNLLALFDNLAMVPPYVSAEGAPFDPNKNLVSTQDMRAINAARQVANNTFGALVGEKAKSTSQSATYMKAVLTQLGVSAADATKLIGDNPSYFAQMEIMSKKIFQDPAFYANLYDSPANIDRQRVAMKAVELQQDRDLLESLRRREMLLSVLLNMRLGTDTGRTNQSGVTTKQ